MFLRALGIFPEKYGYFMCCFLWISGEWEYSFVNDFAAMSP